MQQLSTFNLVSEEVLPTNLTTNRYPVHRWFNFIAGYSPEYVLQCYQQARLDSSACILDPFSGCGTTQVTSNFIGIHSIGYEAHPFFYEIALAKTNLDVTPDQIRRLTEDILTISSCEDLRPVVLSNDAEVFLLKLFPSEDVLRALLKASSLYETIPTYLRPIFRLMLSKVIDLVCHSQTDGIYKAPTSRKNGLSIEAAVAKVSSEIQEDLHKVQGITNRASIFLGSSENMSHLPDNYVDLCVTSPPYLNNFDYAEMTRMYLYFWRYAGSWREISEKVRNKLIVNTTTALSGQREKLAIYRSSLSQSLVKELDKLVAKLDELRRIKPSRKPYHLMIYPYFGQMKSVLSEVHRVLKPAGTMYMVVANSALYGVHIATEQLLAEVMKQVGLEVINISQFRTRGDRWILSKRKGSDKGLGEFEIICRKRA